MIPIWLDVTGMHVLVVGLGQVGQRRALLFQREGAVVTGVDPLPRIQGPEWGELIRNGLELQSQPYNAGLIDELTEIESRPRLVLACATPGVNRQVISDCRRHGVAVSSATTFDDLAPDFQIGAVGRGDAISVSVHTDQASPGLAAAVRDQIAESLLPAAGRLARLASIWRPRILKEINDPATRERLLSLFADRALLALETTTPGSGTEAIKAELTMAYPPFSETPQCDDSA